VLEIIYSNIWIPEIVQERVSDRWAIHSKSLMVIRAQTVMQYEQKTSTG